MGIDLVALLLLGSLDGAVGGKDLVEFLEL